MSPAITIVLGFRDREIERVRRCLDSLAAQTFQDFELLFVDYGSRPEVAAAVRRTVEGYGYARYFYSETRGRPWNRSQALNVGIRRASGRYVMTTDVDMVFAPGFLRVVAGRCSEEEVLYVRTYFLPRGFDDWGSVERYAAASKKGDDSAYGGCQVVLGRILQKIRGFDESFRYWGIEDRDLNRRLRATGLHEEWLDDGAYMFHQWHPPGDIKTPGFMPAGLWGRMEMHHQRLGDEVARNASGWGALLTASDRPVLSFLDEETGGLTDHPDLHWFEARPSDPRSVGWLVRALWALAPGQAMAVPGANLPRRRAWLDLGLRLANRLLRALGSRSEIDYGFNALHTFVAELAYEHGEELADYYLNLSGNGGVSLLVRGPLKERSIEK